MRQRGAGTFYGLHESQEFIAARQRQLFRAHRHTLQLRGRIAINDACLNADLEHVPESSNSVVVARS